VSGLAHGRTALPRFDAIVLAGGRGSRLGGVDKAGLALGGERLVDRAVRAARSRGAERVMVVGPASSAPGGTLTVREDPPGSGPLAALAAGLTAVHEDRVLLLACDLVDPESTCDALLGATSQGQDRADGAVPVDGVVLVDTVGRVQWLAALVRTSALRAGLAAVDGPLADRPLRLAFTRADLAHITVPEGVAADIDTPDDLARARALMENGATEEHEEGAP